MPRPTRRFRPEGMRHDRVCRPVRPHDPLHRFRALDDGRPPRLEIARVGFVVAGQIERDDSMSGLDERFHEDSEVCPAAAPPVHEVYRWPVSPGFARDTVPGPDGFDGFARRDAWRHAQTHLDRGRCAP
ncbi:MAG: hypothetical protein QOG75_5584 [Mycobacterium sp.]|nr:hypothetical protein [Mycobacterium sp.]